MKHGLEEINRIISLSPNTMSQSKYCEVISGSKLERVSWIYDPLRLTLIGGNLLETGRLVWGRKEQNIFALARTQNNFLERNFFLH